MFTILSLACGAILIAVVWAVTHDRTSLSAPANQTAKKAGPPASLPPAKTAPRPLVAKGPETPPPDDTALPRSEAAGLPPLVTPLPSNQAGRQPLPGSRGDHAITMNTVKKSREPRETSPGPKNEHPPPALPKDGGLSSPNAASENRSSQVTEKAPSAQVPEKDLPEPDNLPTRDDPKITLQAIAWAEKKEDRFAMINNRIIKEGGSVAGYTVVSIGKNAVRFRDGGREWYQLFKIR